MKEDLEIAKQNHERSTSQEEKTIGKYTEACGKKGTNKNQRLPGGKNADEIGKTDEGQTENCLDFAQRIDTLL